MKQESIRVIGEEKEKLQGENLAYKKKLTSLAKTMKAPLEERKQLEAERESAKVVILRAGYD